MVTGKPGILMLISGMLVAVSCAAPDSAIQASGLAAVGAACAAIGAALLYSGVLKPSEETRILSRQQRRELDQSLQKASIVAVKRYFTGSGAADRRLQFLRSASLGTASGTMRCLVLVSWAVVAGLLLGPQHTYFLKQIYAWVVATPFGQVMEQSHLAVAAAFDASWKFGLLYGVGRELYKITKPAQQQTKQEFLAARFNDPTMMAPGSGMSRIMQSAH